MPTHGKRGTYTTGCRCDACVEANRVYMRRYRLAATKGLRAAGRLVQSAPVRQALEQLREEEFTAREIARRLGYRSPSVRVRTVTMRRTTAVKILHLAHALLED